MIDDDADAEAEDERERANKADDSFEIASLNNDTDDDDVRKVLSLVLIRAAHCVITQTWPLCFAAFFFYSARDLRGLSADHRESLPHDWKWCNFKN